MINIFTASLFNDVIAGVNEALTYEIHLPFERFSKASGVVVSQ